MNKKLSNKDKKDWEKFVNSKEAIQDKDLQSTKKDFSYIEKIIDLHGYSLEEANIKIEKFILLSFEKGVRKINIITGKGSRSKNLDDPYQSKDLSILKYSVPNYINNNYDLMKLVKEISFEEVNDSNKGSFSIILKSKV